MENYSSVVILSPGITVSNNGPRKIFEGSPYEFSFKIEADPHEFRFKAAQKLYKICRDLNFIIVGGTVEEYVDGKKQHATINGVKFTKAKIIKEILVKDYGISGDHIIELTSESNTMGNMVRLADFLSEKNENFVKKTGLLTNFYHLPRAVKMQAKLGLNLSPICAESIIYDEEFDNIKEFYSGEGVSRTIGQEKANDSEIKGLNNLETGNYTKK